MEADPELPAAPRQLASLYLAQNKTEQAVDPYQTAITLDPENPALFVGICLAYLHQGFFSRSHAMCSHALKLDPQLENAQKLQDYIDAKIAAMNASSQGSMPEQGEIPVPATPPHQK